MITPVEAGKSTSFPISLPSTVIRPEVSGINPHMHFISIVLPLPLRPTIPTISPSPASKFMLSNITFLLIVRHAFSTFITLSIRFTSLTLPHQDICVLTFSVISM